MIQSIIFLSGVQSPSKIKLPADRRCDQWKNAEALPCGYIRPRRGKNARGVLEPWLRKMDSKASTVLFRPHQAFFTLRVQNLCIYFLLLDVIRCVALPGSKIIAIPWKISQKLLSESRTQHRKAPRINKERLLCRRSKTLMPQNIPVKALQIHV